MENYVKERLKSQILSLPIFIVIAFMVDLIWHRTEATPLGFTTLWAGILVPFTAVLIFATVPTLIKKTRSVVRDLIGVFLGATLFGVIASLPVWSSTAGLSDVARGDYASGVMLSPFMGLIVVAIFAISSGFFEYLLHRRIRTRSTKR